MERVYPDKEQPPKVFGPTVDILKVFCWSVRCPPKMKHFLWQLVSGCIAVKKNLRAGRIQGKICCARCAAQEESINHVFFECLPAIQVWALPKYRPIMQSFQPMHSLQIWTIFFGELPQSWKIINLRGYYSISGK